MRFITLFVLITPLLIGCTGAVNDFVEGGGGTTPGPQQPSVDGLGTTGFKLSPGSVTATSPGVNMRATITPTNQQMTSPSVNAEMSLMKSQTQ
jgi:hypothetical protein